MSEKVVGRSQTPSKGRPSNESNAEKSQDSGINVAVQAQLWHNTWTFGLWETLNTWKILIYSLIAWGLYEIYWAESFASFMTNFWPSVNTGLYRFTILAIFTTFFIQFKDEVVGAGNTIRSWFAGFQASNPFFASVVEASVTVALSTAFYQMWMGAGFNWDEIQLSVLLVALYVTPIFSLFNGWMKSWTLGGKRGAFIFTYFVFWPIFLIVLFIFMEFFIDFLEGRFSILGSVEPDMVTQFNVFKSFLWAMPTGERSVPGIHGEPRQWVAGYVWPYVPKQAFAWIFWMTHNYIGDNFVPQQWAAAYTFWGNFAWNIVFVHFILGAWVCDTSADNDMQRNCSAFFKPL